MSDAIASVPGTREQADQEHVRSFIPLVEFLGHVVDRHTEVVLHDLTEVESSVVAIVNGHVSGRTVGSPATDLVLRMRQSDSTEPFISGYKGMADRGRTALRSSTFFIRRGGRLVGMLCVNSDETILNKLNDVVGELLTSHRIAPSPDESDTAQSAHEEPETLAASVAEMTESAVQRAIAQLGIPVERLTPHDRCQLVRTLESKGFFQVRGAVAEVAQQLSISEPTVYRYLQQVRRETESR